MDHRTCKGFRGSHGLACGHSQGSRKAEPEKTPRVGQERVPEPVTVQSGAPGPSCGPAFPMPPKCCQGVDGCTVGSRDKEVRTLCGC